MAQNQQLRVLGQITTEQHDPQANPGTDDRIKALKITRDDPRPNAMTTARTPGQASDRIFERDKTKEGEKPTV
jgi:hypothetical protein